MKTIHIISLILSILWFINSPSWEPAVVTLGIIISLYSYLSANKSSEIINSKVKNIIVLSLLFVAMFFAKPSEDAHKAAILLSIDNYVTDKRQKSNLGFNEECENVTARFHQKIARSFMFGGQKYLNAGMFSISFSGRLISMAALGNIFILSTHDFQVIKEDEANHYLAIKAYNLAYTSEKNNNGEPIKCRKVRNQSPSYVKSLAKNAENGDEFAQWAYGEALYDGDGIKLNKNEAYVWFKKSAINGFAMAQLKVAQMLYFGDGVEKDISEATTWLKKASKNGVPEAKVMLAKILIRSDSVEKKKNGFEILKEYLIDSENPEVQFELALCYYQGWGTEVNNEIAFTLFKKAALQENDKAQLAIAKMYALGQGVQKSMLEFKKWIKKSAENGNKQAKELLKSANKLLNVDS